MNRRQRSTRQTAATDASETGPRLAAGVAAQRAGRLDEARAIYGEVLDADPENADALHLLGLLAHRAGDPAGAVDLIAQAVALAPGHVEAQSNLGNLLAGRGRPDQAEASFRRALAADPGYAPARNHLGVLLQRQGRLDEAGEHFEEAVALKPGDGGYRYNLAKLRREQGRIGEAVDQFAAALGIAPESVEARLGLADSLRTLRPDAYDERLDRLLAGCYGAAYVNHQYLAGATAHQIKLRHGIDRRIRKSPEDFLAQRPDLAARLAEDDLFGRYLRQSFNIDPEIELLLGEVRRGMLLGRRDGGDARRLGFLTSLALQCVNSEHVLWYGDAEKVALDALKTELEQDLETARQVSAALEEKLAVFQLFEPLSGLEGGARLRRFPLEAWSADFRLLAQRTIVEPGEEDDLRSGLPVLGEIKDRTSRAVRSQYEESPFPRWLAMERQPPVALGGMLRRLLPGYAPPDDLDHGAEVLVAGCGTGYQPIRWALSYRDIRVVGVDLSRRSLAYAARMARSLGVTNLELMQGDILDLGGLERSFPIIVCTGVLHHMKDPMAGWAALNERLAPGGLMKLGLYSERARASVVRARALIAARGLEPVAPDIRAFRRDVLLGREGPDFEDLVESRPFYNLSGARDLLFHVMEHRHSLPEIARTIDRLSLRFLGFEIEEPSVKRRYGEQFPADREMTDLACWERFEEANPDAFAGMYQFWCDKPAAR